MQQLLISIMMISLSLSLYADDKSAIERAVLDYIDSQHQVKPQMMERGTDPQLTKRTYWKKADATEFIMQANQADMIDLAARYNSGGDKFPDNPQANIEIFDIDQRVASVKLTTDEWIDYMHLYKNDKGQWKIINVLWQFKDIKRHSSAK